IAEAQCLPLLSRIPIHFLDSGIIVGGDRQKFQQQLASTSRLLNSIWAEVLTVVFAYGIVLASTSVLQSAYAPKWQIQQTTNGFQYTAAGWWHAFISLPVLMFLIFGWLWRQFLWGWLLWRISKHKLRLIAAHPDRVGGLKFLATAVQGYWPLSFAFASIVAGTVANQIRGGSTLHD